MGYQAQFGEDIIIERILTEMGGPANKWCFEVGAHDGVTNSNSHHFIHDEGWSAVLIEADPDLYAKLQATALPPTVHTFNEYLYPGDMDRILYAAGAPVDPDFGVIDIDGQDYYLWESMIEFKPRIMMVEFSPYVDADHLPGLGEDGRGGYNQAGANHIRELGERKGYELIEQTYVNMIFRRGD